MSRRSVWFFDLDDTLHDASHAILATIDRRMTDYVVHHLELEEPDANQLRLTYWRRYGATLLGLTRHHAVDPHHFLEDVHDIPLDRIAPDDRLSRLLERLPGRRFVFTHQSAVTNCIGT